MKKILAMLMSVSMIASLFTAMATTSYAEHETAKIVVTPSSVTSGYAIFDVKAETSMALDFSTEEKPKNPAVPALGNDTYYKGAGIAAATLKFAFNEKYFDLKNEYGVFVMDTDGLASVKTATNDEGFVTASWAGGASTSTTKSPLYRIWVMLNADYADKTVDDLAKMACVTGIYGFCDMTVYSFPSAGSKNESDATKYSYSKADSTLLFDVPDKDAAPADVKVNGITATPAELKALTVGDKGTIAVEVAPADATEKGVTFVSDAEDVISVDADGNYEAKSAGTAKITITAKDGSGVTATVEVSVSAPVIPEPDKVEFVKAVKSDKAATGYWVFKVNKGITETLKVTYANADEKLELDAPAAIGGESDVTFALYLTVTGDRIGKAYTAAVAHGADSATGTAITLD